MSKVRDVLIFSNRFLFLHIGKKSHAGSQLVSYFFISLQKKKKKIFATTFFSNERKKKSFILFCKTFFYVFCSSADYILRFIYHFIYYNLRKLLKSNPSFGNFLRFFSIPELFICFFGCDSNMKSSSSIEKVKM